MIKAIKGSNEVFTYYTILAEDKNKNDQVEFDCEDLNGNQIILPLYWVKKYCKDTLAEKNHPVGSIWIAQNTLYKINSEYQS